VSTLPAFAAGPADVLVHPSDTPDPPDDDDDGARSRRRGGLIGVGLAVLLVGVVVVVALVLATRTGVGGAGIAAGPGPTTADQPGSTNQPGSTDQPSATGTDQASGTGGAASAAPVARAPGTPEQTAQQQAVIDYYALIPTNLAEGWQRLTPSYQRNTAGGFASYSGFWSGMSQTSVKGVSSGPGDTVDATVIYVHQDGSTSQERTLFRMVQQDGTWKIDGSQVLGSS
jgi:hypothetical protein